ncbi:SusC/RagA family TonB-linked outer membrane protein [Flavobacterium sp. GSA192]|uniref:SusC/RagA family TonB-linked outer membrane protein n=1 Tax=Flavobacterium sp. GSA192 TaxID=2576304 RepID=UPI00112D29DC|nr:TonB-dependent receptor [Flavobacterium sp. GSA192]
MKQTFKMVFSVLLFSIMCLNGFAQNANDKVIITGKVVDKDGLGVIGLNVVEKGTKNGVLTDIDGGYRIQVPKGAVLQFTFIGMKTQERKVGDASSINLTMLEDSASLDEVVVVGYGSQKKAHLTGAIQTIKASEVEDLPTNNLASTLVGRVLGVSFSGGTRRPGEESRVNIRRSVSLSKDGGTDQPLYVIDGIIQISGNGAPDSTLFDNLDASEVESISFLKDAAAAVYGSRGANGVVLVTTKRGKTGPAKFTYTGLYGMQDEVYRTKMLNAVEYANYYNIMNGPNGWASTQVGRDTDPRYVFSPDEIEYYKTLNYNPMEDVWKPSYNQKHTMNVTGGTDRATFFAGTSYYTQSGNLDNVDYKRWTYRAGADFKVSDDFKAGIQISGFYNDDSKVNSRVGGTNDENDYRRLLNSSPILPQYIQGLPVQRLNTRNESQYHYFEINRLNNVATNKGFNLTSNFYAEYQVPFVKGLKARASYARNMVTNRSNYIGTRFTLYQFTTTPGINGAGANGHIYDPNRPLDQFTAVTPRTNNNGNRLGWDNTNSLSEQYNFNVSYSRDFGKHSISALASVEKGEANDTRDQFYRDGPLQTTNGFSNSAFGTIDGTATGNESGTLGYIGRVNYVYADKYLAEVLFRSDASTRFAPENYWGRFYSISTGWVISKENFFKSKFIDFLKVRYSLGLLGADGTRAWGWRQRFTYQDGQGFVGGNNQLGTTGLKMEVTPNRDATWENHTKTNFGIDARLFNNRLSLTAEAYYNVEDDILLGRTADVPFTIGGSVASENFGRRDNYGYEFAIGWDDTIGGDFKYGINVNFGWGDDKMVVGDFNPIEILKPWNPQPGGRRDNGAWGYDYVGMLKTQEDIDAYVEKYNIQSVFGVLAANLRPGSLSYADVRGQFNPATGEFGAPDGIIDENDQIRLAKRRNTRYGTGTTLKLGYKNFTLNAVVTASFGGGFNEVDSQTRKTMNSAINDGIDNRPSIWNNIYDPVLNPNGTMPNPYSEALNLSPTSSFWQRSATSIQMRNINLGYTMPKKYTDALGISSCRLNLTAINPFILYNPFEYKAPNGAYDIYPELKTYSLGLNLSF